MTVSTELSHEEYVGNGVTTDFDFRFRIFEGKHLIVVVADSDGIETTLKNGTDYTIVGAGSYHGGKVVLNKPLAQGWKVLLERDLPVVQETDLRNQGKFFAEVHEDAFDYLTMLIQKALGTFSLSLRKPTYLSNYYDAKGNRIANLAPPKSGSDSANKDYVDNSIKDIDSKTLRVKDKPINALPNTEQRANKILAFDSAGQPITVLPESGSASDVLIELDKPTGASLIGTSGGLTVQEEINKIENELDNIINSKPNLQPPSLTDFSILRFSDRRGEGYEDIKQYSVNDDYSDPYPQALTRDPLTKEYLIFRSATKEGKDTQGFIDIYDKNFSHLKTVIAGKDWSELLVVGYVNGERRLLVGEHVGYGVFKLPETSSITNFTMLQKLLSNVDDNLSQHGGSYGEYVIMRTRKGTVTWRYNKACYYLYNKSDLLQNENPKPISNFLLPIGWAGSYSNLISSNPKCQSTTLTPFGVAIISGNSYHKGYEEYETPNTNLRISIFNANGGNPYRNVVYSTSKLLSLLSENGLKRPNNKGDLVWFEPESIYFDDGELLALFVTSEMELIVSFGKNSNNNHIDVGKSIIPITASDGIYTSSHYSSFINTVGGEFNQDLTHVCEYMIEFGKRNITFISRDGFKVGENKINKDCLIDLTNINDNHFCLKITDVYNGGRTDFFFGDLDAKIWNKQPVIFGGAEIGNSVEYPIIQFSSTQSDPNKVIFNSVTSKGNTIQQFRNKSNQCGSIVQNESSVNYNNTSDERMKLLHGKINNPLGIIKEMVEYGAVQSAAYKSSPDDVYPMLIAQKLKEFAPYAVTDGKGEIGDEEFVPYSVDYSKLIPLIISAIHELFNIIK
ncbi:hypothetical protein [Proteus terrae]|uniref:hypothetical protein n=1 Tax=Proteus terrae TaxID=1574161 RepID=UPI001C5EED0E|nr:hypothetical protein [Proteus terrae]